MAARTCGTTDSGRAASTRRDRSGGRSSATPDGRSRRIASGAAAAPRARHRPPARWRQALRAYTRRPCSSTRAAVPPADSVSFQIMLPATPVCWSGPSAPEKRISCCATTYTTMRCVAPPLGNRSHKHPPGRASSDRLAAFFENVCAGFHQRPTRLTAVL